MDHPDTDPATAEAPSPCTLQPGRRSGKAPPSIQGQTPSHAILALRHIGLRLGITILIAAAIQLACDWSAS